MTKRGSADWSEDGKRQRRTWPAVTDGEAKPLMPQGVEHKTAIVRMMHRCQECQEALSRLKSIGADELI